MKNARWYLLIALALLIAVVLTNCCITHDWTEPACEMPSVCSKCGKTRGESLGGHKWTDASCTDPAVCSVCGETAGSPIGHAFSPAGCETAKTCSICGFTEGEALGHEWLEADCVHARTCSRCGVTEGEAPGHSWADADCITPVTCSVCGAEAGSAIGHFYAAADCVTPKTCSVCGETEGEALGHSWRDADCESAKTCTVCGETEGEALGHSWLDASCTLPETCERCGLTRGAALGHRLGGKWDAARQILLGEKAESRTCSVCLEMLPVQTEDCWQYVILNDTVTIVGCEDGKDELIIPRSIEGLPVTAIGDLALINCTSARTISIPRCVTEIGANPFAGLKAEIILADEHPALELRDGVLFDIRSSRLISYPMGAEAPSYDIPEGTCILGDYAFLNCTALRSIRIPDSVIAIGQDPFAMTTARLQISAENPLLTVTDGALFEKASKRLVHYSAGNRDRIYGIPAGILSVDDLAFAGCVNLSVITIPDSVLSIGDMAFSGCSSLTGLTLPESVGHLGEMVFMECPELKSLRLPEGLQAIGFAALYGCTGLESLQIPASVTAIAEGAFHSCSGLTKLTIPESVAAIGTGAFDGCEGLRLIVTAGSDAEKYCEENGIGYEYPADMSWLAQ